VFVVKLYTYELSNSRYAFRFNRNKLTVCCQFIHDIWQSGVGRYFEGNPYETQPKHSYTVILIAVLSGFVSVTSVEYGYVTCKYVVTLTLLRIVC